MLNIDNLDKLKITKIKPWCIYFTYDNKYYMVHEDSEGYYGYINLYERIINENGTVMDTIPLETNVTYYSGISNVSELIKNKYTNTKRCLIYKHLDKEYFVKKLTMSGYIKSKYSKEIDYIEFNNKFIRNQINILREQINELKYKLI